MGRGSPFSWTATRGEPARLYAKARLEPQGYLCWVLPTFLFDQSGWASSVPYFRVMLTVTGKMQVPRAVPWEKSTALTEFSNGYLTPSG